MPFRNRATLVLLLLSTPLVSAAAAETPLPEALATPGETVVLTAHAEGMQIYECKAGTDGKLAWAFREPVATLIADDKIVGRHFAGPTWQLSDGSARWSARLSPARRARRQTTSPGSNSM